MEKTEPAIFTVAHAVAHGNHATQKAVAVLVGTLEEQSQWLEDLHESFKKQKPSSRSMIWSSDEYCDSLVRAIMDGKIEDLRRHIHEEIELLLIDQLHLLFGKERTQIELASSIEKVLARGGRVVVTAKTLAGLIPSLQKHFEEEKTGQA